MQLISSPDDFDFGCLADSMLLVYEPFPHFIVHTEALQNINGATARKTPFCIDRA